TAKQGHAAPVLLTKLFQSNASHQWSGDRNENRARLLSRFVGIYHRERSHINDTTHRRTRRQNRCRRISTEQERANSHVPTTFCFEQVIRNVGGINAGAN